ncbi:MAG TPA: pitrilysin family protein [Candidatus Saccharimonadia bacterium]|nr:pitrilysin family protein [Candidatus Saccharimonadia bacterium]
MKVAETTLENGLRIVTASLADAHSVTVNIVVGTGSRFEEFTKNGGVSHFLEHLLFKGSQKYPSAQIIAETVDAVGGYNNAYTTEDVTSYYIKVPARHLDLALDILADMVKTPLLDAEEIDRERGVIIEEMNVFRDDPSRQIGMLVPSLIFPNNPLGGDILGTEEVIKSIPRAAIAGYLGERYRPNNLVVAVAGAVDHEEAVAKIRASLGDMTSGELATFKPVADGLDRDLVVAHAKPTAQAHFMVAARGYAYEDADEPTARLVAAILGRGMSSRLFLNVRERQGLAYSVFAETNSFVDTGLFEAYAGVNLDKIQQALDSVLHELEVIRHEEPAAAELDKAKQQLIAGLEMSLESNSNIADRIGTQLVLLGRVRTIEDSIARIEAVKAADIRRVAAAMLDPQRLRFAIIAPEPDPVAAHFVEYLGKFKEKS